MDLGLVEFLTARLDEVERTAQAAGHGCGYVFHEHNAGWVEVSLPEEHNCRPVYDIRHIARHDPASALADVKAKRAVVAIARDMLSGTHETWGDGEAILSLLAQPYADHPDFDPAW